VEARPQHALPRFRLDTANECLWRGDEAIPLQPKAFAFLKYLSERGGRLVTKGELLQALWPRTAVTEGVLKACVKTLREALGDDPGHPRYIETVHRRGYRFIGRLDDRAAPLPAIPRGPEPGTPLVGRERPLAALRERLGAARLGERQLLFVTGEAGIGKTTLVEAFLQEAAEGGAVVARGACLEQYGGDAGYLPWLDALATLCREAGALSTVARHAPTWLAQVPALAASAPSGPAGQALGTSREHMLREMASALEALAAERPLAFLLEDLHWSDYSSLDLVSYLARRREPARLLLIGTYRPVEVILGDHPLKAVKAELAAHRLCAEMPLEFLSEAAVGEYLALRFRRPMPAALARLVHERSEGSPLFMVNVADDLVARRVVVQAQAGWEVREGPAASEGPVPEGILQLIERMVDRLGPEERRLLETASVAGVEFTAAAVAAGLGADPMEVEGACDALARRRQLLAPADSVELPDGTVSSCYRFIHSLYRSALYGSLPAGRRAHLHRRIGEQREAAHGRRASDVALELALHFEEGGDAERAVPYLLQAAESARGRFANQEAVALARRGLALLPGLAASEGRDRLEMKLQLTLGLSVVNTVAFSAPEIEASMARARELCHRLGDPPELSVAVWGLWVHDVIAGRLPCARELATQLSTMAGRAPEDRLLAAAAHAASGFTDWLIGSLPEAQDRIEALLEASTPELRRTFRRRFGLDPAVYGLSVLARVLWLRGHPEKARRRMSESLAMAEEAGDPRSRIYASLMAASLHRSLGEPREAQARAEECLALCEEHGVSQERGFAELYRARALAESSRLEEGMAVVREAAVRLRGLFTNAASMLDVLMDVLRKAGRLGEALAAAEEALEAIEGTGERFWEAETHRVKGELLLEIGGPSAPAAAEACFRRALEIAGRQGARSLELRAAMSLGRLLVEGGQREEARRTVEERYRWFTEGFDTPDLKRAAALLAESS
jgi:DNA-binding winged helix-turn-helix (wHTH) protein/tetratricopeptide (TPR) repeat protein